MSKLCVSRHRVYKGDCLDILHTLPDKCVDLVVTDPPYEISTDGGGTVNSIKKFNKSLKQLDEADLTKGYDIETVCTELMRVMKEPNIYIWCNKKQIPLYLKFLWKSINVPLIYCFGIKQMLFRLIQISTSRTASIFFILEKVAENVFQLLMKMHPRYILLQ